MKKLLFTLFCFMSGSLFLCSCNNTEDMTVATLEEIVQEYKVDTCRASNIEVEIETIEEVDESEIIMEEYLLMMEEYESTDNYLDWYIKYKYFITENSDVCDKPETIYDVFSDEELDLMFRVVQAEIGDEYSFEQKVHVANVIFNRVAHYKFPDTLKEVLIPSQFSTISSGRYKRVEVSEATILACEFAYEIEDLTDGCLFFDSNGVLNYKLIMNDGAHNLYKLHKE